MWLKSDKIDAVLANFIHSLAQARPFSRSLLLVDSGAIKVLADTPSPALSRAWEELFRAECRDPVRALSKLESFPVTAALTGLAVILNNRVAAGDKFDSASLDRAADYNRSLLDSLSVPKTEPEISGFDLPLLAYCDFLRQDEERSGLDQFQQDLLNFSPFTALKSFDLLLPGPLPGLVSEYLPHYHGKKDLCDSDPWWRQVAEIVAQPDLVHSLLDAWLRLPESRLSCLGLGLFLEELRRRGPYDPLILSFFEAYEFMLKVVPPDPETGRADLIKLIASQLGASGDSLSGRRLNQVGNEYFMKFRALLEIVAARGGVPGEFRHLTHDFCFKRLLPLVPLATITGGQRLKQQASAKFSEVRFS